jgi:hydrogenase maturation protease
MTGSGPVVVIGIGNEYRRDDGIGPEVLARLRGRVPQSVRLVVSDGEPASVVEAWTGASLAVVVDAVRADPPVPGRMHRLVLGQADAARLGAVSSHGLGLADAIGLALALGRMPGRLIMHAVEAGDVGHGTGLTPPVAAAAAALTTAVLADLAAG